MDYIIKDDGTIKSLISPSYSYLFNKTNGMFYRWGKTKDDDPDYSPFGPEIADIEITTICNGVRGELCPFCYKSNNPDGSYMTFDTYKKVFDNLPDTLTQIAFGVDSTCTTNPDVWEIMKYTRDNGIIPNVTIADASDEVADKISDLCGACAVSRYRDKNVCYDTVKKLTDRGMDQCNIHVMISEETFHRTISTLKDTQNDTRLKNLNAVVFLSLKTKGRGEGYTQLSDVHFKQLVDYAFDNDIPIGFDSCSAIKFLDSIKEHKDYGVIKNVVEPCESTRFSIYIDVDGMASPCSFTNDYTSLDVKDCNFIKDIWYNKDMVKFRKGCSECLSKDISCQIYNI